MVSDWRSAPRRRAATDRSSWSAAACPSESLTRAIQILKACGVSDLTTVNVLEDQEIRQGIKEYSDWPTIPQLYVNGEFIGGSDIMTEMYQSGELQPALGQPA